MSYPSFQSNLEAITKQIIPYQIKTDLLINNLEAVFAIWAQTVCRTVVRMISLSGHLRGKPWWAKTFNHQNKLILFDFFNNVKKKLLI